MNDLQAMAEHLGFSKGAVEYIGTDRDIQGVLWISDVVVYASYLNEQAFPPSLVRAMSLQRPVIAPKQATFKEYVSSPFPVYIISLIIYHLHLWFRKLLRAFSKPILLFGMSSSCLP